MHSRGAGLGAAGGAALRRRTVQLVSEAETVDPAHLFDLHGRVALVTGGSRGLGRQMALAFARAGADVVVASRKIDSCREVAGEINALGRRGVPVAANVGRWGEIEALVATVYQHFDRVHVLVNNAGMSLPYSDVADVTETMWDRVVDLNLKGPFRLTALMGARMAEGGGGSVINVSSTGSIRPTPFILPYAAAKAGLNSLTTGFAHTFGPSVRVNGIMAGPFFTDVTKGWDLPAFREEAARRFALQRGGEPGEIVGAALYFASDASTFTTGAILRVDGGIP
jgi:NAD(P)-dependent dehydrogenase (short-subunit alcohol dehydrogenase family)